MTETLKALEQLVVMAINTKGEKRQDLFHAVTVLYLENADEFDTQERNLFGEVIGAVLFDVDVGARATLAERLAEQDSGPHNLSKKLLNDETAVCLPLLKDCAWLTDDELVADLSNRGPEEVEALGERENLSEKVTASIVQSGQMLGIKSLLRNNTAQIDVSNVRNIVDATTASGSDITTLIDENDTLPIHLAAMFFHVTHGDRLRILQQLKEDFDSRGLNDLSSQEYSSAASSDAKVERGLIETLRAENHETFQSAFANAINVDEALVQRILEDEGAEALAVVCKSRSFQRATFSTFALLVKPTKQRSPQQVTRLMSLYENLDQAAAYHVVQLWRGNTTSLPSREYDAA